MVNIASVGDPRQNSSLASVIQAGDDQGSITVCEYTCCGQLDQARYAVLGKAIVELSPWGNTRQSESAQIGRQIKLDGNEAIFVNCHSRCFLGLPLKHERSVVRKVCIWRTVEVQNDKYWPAFASVTILVARYHDLPGPHRNAIGSSV